MRSQDKMDLFKINRLKIREHTFEDGKKEYFILNNNSISDAVGVYKTKERALEILDEIQNISKPQKVLSKVGKPIAETCDGTIYREPDEYDIKEPSIYVYEMPKE